VDTNHYIVTAPQCRPNALKVADYAAANAVADHGALRDLFADHHDGAWVRVAGGAGLNRQNPAGVAVTTLLVNTGNFGSLTESVLSGEHVLRLWLLNGYALTAFVAAALEDEPSGSGSHARNETMHTLAAAFLRLVRSLRHD